MIRNIASFPTPTLCGLRVPLSDVSCLGGEVDREASSRSHSQRGARCRTTGRSSGQTVIRSITEEYSVYMADVWVLGRHPCAHIHTRARTHTTPSLCEILSAVQGLGYGAHFLHCPYVLRVLRTNRSLPVGNPSADQGSGACCPSSLEMILASVARRTLEGLTMASTCRFGLGVTGLRLNLGYWATLL